MDKECLRINISVRDFVYQSHKDQYQDIYWVQSQKHMFLSLHSIMVVDKEKSSLVDFQFIFPKSTFGD